MIRHIFRRFSTTSYTTSKRIQVPSDVFYKTVINVADYKNFVPLTEESTIISKVSDTEFFGKLTVNFKVYQGSFVSRVLHTADTQKRLYKVVSISKESTVLKSLESRWAIQAVDEKTSDVDYSVDYEFSSRLYQHAASMLMNTVARGTLDAFEKRAIEVKERNIEPEKMVAPSEEPQEILEEHHEHTGEHKKPGIISKMLKPRRKIVATAPHDRKVDDLIISKLTALKSEGKLDDLSFYKVIDRFYNDVAIKDQIKNLYMLQKDGMLTDVHLITYLKELLDE